ncbi:MAG: excinuclease ABC subunit UvrB [Candidatus Fermentibacteraceae bacterium]|nr:excinuclease ABC subunit UvrB [Candidatus Fermentibacteraceae bacterium]
MSLFKLVSDFKPSGHQPAAIESLTEGLRRGEEWQTLLGVTGSGKTFTMAGVIAGMDRPVLVVSHNKTLAAQLYSELRGFFPDAAVEYFVSYYDYYQPEAYIPTTDTFIEKDADLNEELDRLRLRASASLLSRRDVIVVASVSCIYGLGNPSTFAEGMLHARRGMSMDMGRFMMDLVDMRYSRNDVALTRGRFRVRGDVLDVVPAYGSMAVRVEFFGSSVESIRRIDHLTGAVQEDLEEVFIYPARHFVTSERELNLAIGRIERELEETLGDFRQRGKLLEAQRLESRTRYDIELLAETGYCSGIENYSRHLSGRGQGERPACLIDYFTGGDMLVFIDESHRTIPQLAAMYRGDRSRKETLVENGFRLPSALDNRPLYLEEFVEVTGQKVCMSATPSEYELSRSARVVQQIVRPTGLVDPEMEVRPASTQIDDLVSEINRALESSGRVLVTTLTKKMAEELTSYLQDLSISARYIHSEVDALERVSILRELRLADFDVLVGVNLLREGLDLPEVSLVAILDADKEGFLRSRTSLIQTAGRAARNMAGKVILYADRMTDSMEFAMGETARRRAIQLEYNEKHGITPESIRKSRDQIISATSIADIFHPAAEKKDLLDGMPGTREEAVLFLEGKMLEAAERLDFETAAKYRDAMRKMEA